VEPGLWTSWAPSDELKELAGLASHLYADASEAARVNFAAEVVPESERRKLTHNAKALPRVLDLIAVARKGPVEGSVGGSGGGSDAGSGGDGSAQHSGASPAASAVSGWPATATAAAAAAGAM